MNDVVLVLLCAAGCAAAGWLAPLWVRAIPEPELKEGEEGKEAYAAIAGRRWFPPTSAALSAVGGAVVAWSVGSSWLLVGLLPLVPVLVGLGIIDARTRFLPTRVVLPATGVLLLLTVAYAGLVGEWGDLWRGLILMLVARSFFWILWFLRSSGLGFGDVRLSALLGLALGVVGVQQWLVGLFSSFFLFAIPGLVWALVRWDRSILKRHFPFGPAMIVGALLGLALGEPLLEHLVVQ